MVFCDFFAETAAGMLVNGFKKKFGEDKAILNIQVIFNSLPDILRQAQQK